MARPKKNDKKEQRYTLLLRPVLWDILEQHAETEGLTVNALIEQCLQDRFIAESPITPTCLPLCVA